MPKLRRTPEEKAIDDFNSYVLLFQKKNNIRLEDIGEMLNLSKGAISKRIHSKTRWNLAEIATLVEEFGVPFKIGE